MRKMYLYYVAIINRLYIILKHDNLSLPSKNLQSTRRERWHAYIEMITQNYRVKGAASYRIKMYKVRYREVSLRLWAKRGPHEFMDSDIL